MAEEEKRASERKKVAITTIIKKQMPNGSSRLMEFLSENLSQGGVFIMAEDLALFDLGEELDIIVDIRGDKFYEGRARVVRSARIFAGEQQENESGFGLMFLRPDDDFRAMQFKKLESVN